MEERRLVFLGMYDADKHGNGNILIVSAHVNILSRKLP